MMRTIEQWEKCDARTMSQMSRQAIFWAIFDAKKDIAELAALAGLIQPRGEPVAPNHQLKLFE